MGSDRHKGQRFELQALEPRVLLSAAGTGELVTTESMPDPATGTVAAFDSFNGHGFDALGPDSAAGFLPAAADPFAGLERSELTSSDIPEAIVPAPISPHALTSTGVTNPVGEPRDLLAIGNPAVGFATGDFDGDGRLDLAILTEATTGLVLFSGTAAGAFAAAGVHAVGAGARQIVAADLDGRRGLDLVVLSQTEPELAVFLNDGAGQFTARPRLALGGSPVGMAIADIDGVPGVEIVVVHGLPGRLQVLFAGVGGEFSPEFDRPLAGQLAQVAVGDVTGDDRPDLLIARGDAQGGVSILDNRGDGLFAEPRTVAGGTAYRKVLAADTDRDGDVDLVAINGRGGVASLSNPGGGAFSQTSTSFAGQDLADLALGDFNNDGWVDTLVLDRGGGGRLLWRLNPGGSATNPGWTSIATVDGAESLTLTDTDADGDGDVLYLAPATGKVGGVGLTVPGRASGTVYRDFNGNGLRDPDEPGLAGVAVYHDANANGQADERILERSSLSQLTVQGGRSETVLFSGMPAMTVRDLDVELALEHQGSLNDMEVKLTGPGGVSSVLIPAGSGLSGTRLVGTVLDDDAAQGLLAGADPRTGAFKPPGSLQVFEGVETTGTWILEVRNAVAAGAFAPRLVLRSAKLIFKGAATQTVTDREGRYSLPGLNPGSGWLGVVPDARFGVSSPAEGHHVLNLRPGGAVEGLDFGARSLLGRASGRVWLDRDGDGVADAEEPGVEGRDVYADLNGNGRLDGRGVVQSGPLSLATVNNSSVSTTLNVAGFPGKVVDVDLMLEVAHPEAGYDLTVVLWNPSNAFVNVVINLFDSGQADFDGLVLDDEAERALNTGLSPFEGAFPPSNPLAVLDGKAAEGTWILEIADRGFNQTGVLKGWGLRITTDQAEPVARTGADGRYRLSDLPAGAVVVRQAPLPEGWSQTHPPAGAGHTFTAGGGTHAENLDFGDRVAGGTLTGRVWVDLDGDRKLETPVEPLLANWRVYLDTVTVNGRLDAGEPNVLTDRDGRYVFPDLPAGLYAVGVVIPDAKVVEPDWIQTSPESGVHQVELGAGRTLDDLDFAVLQLAEIRGQVFLFEPTGPDGEPRDQPYQPLSPWTVMLDGNGNGRADPGEAVATTRTDDPATPEDETGTFVFANLSPGIHRVGQEMRGGYVRVEPLDPPYIPATLASGQVLSGLRLVVERAEIGGTLFDDVNRNGVREANEAGLADWAVELDRGDNGSVDAATRTDAAGVFGFTGVGAGVFRVRAVTEKPFVQTAPATPGTRRVTVSDTGVRPEPVDFGYFHPPDLQIAAMPSQAVPLAETVQVTFTSRSEGPGKFGPEDEWAEELWLTDDGVLDGFGWELLVGSRNVRAPTTTALPVGLPKLGITASIEAGGVVTVEMLRTGLFWNARLDPATKVVEVDDQNNARKEPVRWLLPDLRIDAGPQFCFPDPCPEGGRVEEPRVSFDPDKRMLAVAGEVRYPVVTSGPIPETAGWWEQVWLGTDADVSAPNDPKRGVWHVRVGQMLVSGIDGPRIANTVATERRLPLNLAPTRLPKEIDLGALKWIVLLDRPPGSTPREADPGDLLETHEVAPLQSPPYNNVYLQPLQPTWVVSLNAKGEFQDAPNNVPGAPASPGANSSDPSVAAHASVAPAAPRPEPPLPIEVVYFGGVNELSLSETGRFVAFSSDASNLVSGDTNRLSDIFVYDRDADNDGLLDELGGTRVERVSVGPRGAQADGHSWRPVISADGRYVAFESDATNLVVGDHNGNRTTGAGRDVFWHDRVSGRTVRVSVQTGGGEANSGGSKPSISADGMVIAFESFATNLVRGSNPYAEKPLEDPRYPWSGDNNGGSDVFIHDIRTGVTTRVSVDAAGEEGRIFTPDPDVPVQFQYRPTGSAHEPAISADGRSVVFRSSVVHVPGPEFIRNVPVTGDGGFEILLKDLRSGQVRPVTRGNGPSFNPTLSADGEWVAFQSFASDLVANDGNGQGASTFVWNRATGQMLLASVDDQGRQVSDTGLRVYGRPALSADGRLIAFLGAAEPNHRVWVRDLAAGQSWWVSAPAPGILAQSFANLLPTLSANGLWAGFTSADERLVDGIANERFNTFVRYVEPVELGEVRGTVYRDADRDGRRDPEEPGLTGITVVLDRGADGVADLRVVTQPNGFFTFTNVIEGRHRIRIEPDPTLLATAPPADMNEGWLEFFLPGADAGRLEPQELGVAPKPDLTVRSLTLQPVELGGQAVIRYVVEDLRQGVITADDRWLEEVWLTDDGLVDGAGYERLLTTSPLDQFWFEGERVRAVQLPRVSDVEAGPDIVSPQQVKDGLEFVVRLDPETLGEANPAAGTDKIEGSIDEADERNNTRTAAAKWKLPDLVASLPGRIEGFGFDRMFEKPLIYRIANRGEAPLPEGASWYVHVWLGTDEQVWLADDVANGVWHRRIPTTSEQILWFTGHGVRAPGSSAEREIRIDLRGVQQPEGIDVASLKWIVLVDWGFTGTGVFEPVRADDSRADPGKVIERHEADPVLDITLRPPNAFAFPVSTIDIRPFRVETGLNTKLDWTGLALEGEGSFKLGLEPAPGEPFKPLLSLQGKLAVNPEKIEFEGEARIAIFGGVDPLLSKGKWSLDVKKGLAKLAQAAADAVFEFSGMKVKIDTLTFKNDPKDGAVIEIQGGLIFPRSLADLTLEVTDPHKIRAGARDMFIDGGKITLPDDTTLQLFGIDVFKAENLSLDYTHVDAENPANNRSFKIQGRVSLPFFYNLTADLCPAGGEDGACGPSGDGGDEEPMPGDEPKGTDNFLRIRQDGIDLVGSISAEDLIVVPGAFAIKNVTVTVDTTKRAFAGEGLVLLPGGLGISGGLGFVGSDLNFIALGATNINKPIGATGAFLQLISGQLNHLAPGDPEPPEFKGSIGFTAGPQFTVPLPKFLGGKFEGSLANVVLTGILDPAKIRGEGELVIIGGLLTGKGSAELNWFEHALKVEGQLALPADIATLSSSFKADYRKYDFSYRTQTQVKIPKEIKLIGGLTLVESNLMVQYKNNTRSDDDFIAMWRKVSLGSLLGEVTLGLRINLDGSWELLGTERAAALAASPAPATVAATADPAPGGVTTPRAQLASLAPASAAFNIPAARDWVLFEAGWDNAVAQPPTLQIVDPTGTIHDTSRLAADGALQRVVELSGPTRQVFVVRQPLAGTWVVRVPNPTGLVNLQLDALLPTQAPALKILTPTNDTAAPQVDLDFEASDADSEATISWYYDNDRTGYDGLPIGETSIERDGRGRFTWVPANDGVATGDYYLYGVISDGRSAPVFSDYSVGRVAVTEPGAPGGVQGLRAGWGGGDAIELEWFPVPNAASYLIRYATEPTSEFYDGQAVARGAAATASVAGLTPGHAYRFTVQAVDAEGLLGRPSAPIVAIVGPALAPGAAGGETVFAVPGSAYRTQAVLEAGIAYRALRLPTGATFDPNSGVLLWNVPADGDGWNEWVLIGTRNDGTTDLRRSLILVQPRNTGTLDGVVFQDFDGDTLQSAGEGGLDGWVVELRDARTGAVLASRTTAGVDRNTDGRVTLGAESGRFVFADLVPGRYRIEVVRPAGWAATAGGGSVRSLWVTAGEVAASLDGFRQPLARIEGRVFIDGNENGIQDAGEPAGLGTQLFLDLNGNAILDRVHISRTQTDLQLTLPGRGIANSTLWVQGQAGRVASVSVEVSLEHEYLADLELTLVSPSGARVPLFAAVPVEEPGRLVGARFDDGASARMDARDRVFQGGYKPLVRLDSLRGEDPNGAWRLETRDDAAGDAGTLHGWALHLTLDEPEVTYSPSKPDAAYVFHSLAPGEYRVVALPPNGYAAVATGVTPGGGSARTIQIAAGQTAAGLDFALQSRPLIVLGSDLGSRQRSFVRSLTFGVGYGYEAPAAASALTLVELGSSRIVPTSAFDFRYDATTREVSWSGTRLAAGGLDEGRYRATVTLPRTGGTATEVIFDFHVLRGDANGDARVNELDLFAVWQPLSNRTQQIVPVVDLDGDGRTTSADLDLVAENYRRELPAPVPASGTSTTTPRDAPPITSPASQADLRIPPGEDNARKAAVAWRDAATLPKPRVLFRHNMPGIHME